MTETATELWKLARDLARDSVVTQALERYLTQVIEVCAEHEKASVATLRAQNAELVAALEEARHHFVTSGRLHSLDMRGPIHRIDAALAAAGQAQRSGE